MSSAEDFWSMVEVAGSSSSDGVYVVRMQGLPYSVTRDEIVGLMQTLCYCVANVHL